MVFNTVVAVNVCYCTLAKRPLQTIIPVSVFVVPSAAPTSVSVSEVTSSSITVQWGAVNCIHRNGDIAGYSVRYGVQGSGSTEIESVSGGGATMATIFGLESSTTYTIEVAAVNTAGTGVYSTPIITIEIPNGKTVNGSMYRGWYSLTSCGYDEVFGTCMTGVSELRKSQRYLQQNDMIVAVPESKYFAH